eukprot:gb/GFBE01063910.1/.p1 GENE.gb/GFBE01063910.1/~~gb/GFBE01063910.1/.p1  ORF type:complete len:100 (+),score=22.27 gb/GFBE01063910.1/:1-300(+)
MEKGKPGEASLASALPCACARVRAASLVSVCLGYNSPCRAGPSTIPYAAADAGLILGAFAASRGTIAEAVQVPRLMHASEGLLVALQQAKRLGSKRTVP